MSETNTYVITSYYVLRIHVHGGRVDGADVVSVQKGVAEHADGDTEEQPGRHARLSLRHHVSPGPHTPTSTCHVTRDNNVT